MAHASTVDRLALPLLALVAGAAATHCDVAPEASADAWKTDPMSGGDTTVVDTTRDAYSRTAPGIDPSRMNQFFVGNSFFNSNWVTAPASAEGRDGLGPTFNASACSGCRDSACRIVSSPGPLASTPSAPCCCSAGSAFSSAGVAWFRWSALATHWARGSLRTLEICNALYYKFPRGWF